MNDTEWKEYTFIMMVKAEAKGADANDAYNRLMKKIEDAGLKIYFQGKVVVLKEK
jgi:uncharacterized protein (DUF302 family)